MDRRGVDIRWLSFLIELSANKAQKRLALALEKTTALPWESMRGDEEDSFVRTVLTKYLKAPVSQFVPEIFFQSFKSF